MNILFLASGGDAPGMNFCLYQLCEKLKNNNLFASFFGYRGLIENNILPISLKTLKKERYNAGVCIKTSRCPEFKTQEGFAKALKNIKGNSIDIVVILGGDGSFKGAKELVSHGVNVVFIPATIDNDMAYQTTTIGLNTAVEACVQYIKNVMPSMQAFNRSCIFEVMGRNNFSIAKLCAERVNADLVLSSENENITTLDSEKTSTIVVLQENLMDINALAQNLEQKFGGEFKTAKVGYVQRGTAPTKSEIQLCKKYVALAINAIKNKTYPCAIQICQTSCQILSFDVE